MGEKLRGHRTHIEIIRKSFFFVIGCCICLLNYQLGPSVGSFLLYFVQFRIFFMIWWIDRVSEMCRCFSHTILDAKKKHQPRWNTTTGGDAAMRFLSLCGVELKMGGTPCWVSDSFFFLFHPEIWHLGKPQVISSRLQIRNFDMWSETCFHLCISRKDEKPLSIRSSLSVSGSLGKLQLIADKKTSLPGKVLCYLYLMQFCCFFLSFSFSFSFIRAGDIDVFIIYAWGERLS